MKILLYEYRKHIGMSLRELSEITGMSKSFLSKVERGETTPKMEQMELLAKALNVQINDLFDSEYK